MCCEMYMKSFADITRDMDTAFFYFFEVQVKNFNDYSTTLCKWYHTEKQIKSPNFLKAFTKLFSGDYEMFYRI